MKKRIASLSCLLLLLCSLFACMPVLSVDTQQRVFDDAELLTGEEIEGLERKIASITGEIGLDLAVVTVDDNSKTAQEYADDFYDEHGFGIGEKHSGSLLLIDMDHREYYITTTGRMINILDDARIDNILNQMEPNMKDQKYGAAMETYLDVIYGYATDNPVPLPDSAEFDRIFDGAGLFTPGQNAVLQSRIDALRSQHGADVAVVTTINTGGKTAQEYAQDCYRAKGLGDFGVLLLIDMDHRDVFITTSGQMVSAFSGTVLEDTIQSVLKEAKEGDYYQASLSFLKDTERVTQKANKVAQRTSPASILLYAFGSLAVGFIVCLIVWLRYRSRGKAYAYPFHENGRMNLVCNEDTFLTETIDRRYSPPPPPPSSGGSGGSRGGGGGSFGGGRTTTHTSSSGSTHGGGGRGF